MNSSLSRPYLGYGLGLRRQHYETILQEKPAVRLVRDIDRKLSRRWRQATALFGAHSADYPMVMHGVSLSIGSSDPLNLDYLQTR